MVEAIKGKVVCCIVARTNSTRLPGKVLRKVSGRRMIEHIIERMKAVPHLRNIYIATSVHHDDEVLCTIAHENGIKAYRGSELSVIDRLLDIADLERAEYVVRVTGDNIYTDTRLLELLIQKVQEADADYARAEGAPIGVTAEVMKVTALKHCTSRIDSGQSEYLMLYMFNPGLYRTVVVDVSDWVPPLTSLTVDTPEDWARTEFIERKIGGIRCVTLSDIIELSTKQCIPHFRLDGQSPVKLPKGGSVTLEKFVTRQSDLSRKCQFHVEISKEEYENV